MSNRKVSISILSTLPHFLGAAPHLRMEAWDGSMLLVVFGRFDSRRRRVGGARGPPGMSMCGTTMRLGRAAESRVASFGEGERGDDHRLLFGI
jgi:hypothetical protein